MVIYQALHGDYKTFVISLSKFMEEVNASTFDMNKADDTSDTGSIEEQTNKEPDNALYELKEAEGNSIDRVNNILLSFLDADSYTEKLELITTNIKAMDDRLINDMAASLDCTVEEGPMDHRLQELIYCLKQLSRFEVRR